MGFQVLLLLFLCSIHAISAKEPADASIIIRGLTPLAETDDNYVCATLDLWPPEKCNYNQCPWGQASIFSLDLSNPLLAKAIQAFDPLRIRIGGSLQDQLTYGVGNSGSQCVPFKKMPNGLFGFSSGCLSMDRWNELNVFFNETRAVVSFGLNALHGRHKGRKHVWEGPWESSNARSFIEYTISKGYQIDAWEFGNELSGKGVGASVYAYQYGKDVIRLKSILDELYNTSNFKPLLLAPGGFFDSGWFSRFLQVSGEGVVDVITHHIYNLGSGDDAHLIDKILDPNHLDKIVRTFGDLQQTIQRNGAWATAWVGESGGAYNSGGRSVSNTFVNSFWYLDQLGMASKYNTKVYCRQSLIGGNYGLLNTTTFAPNPDYYSALLWHHLMGKTVLDVDFQGSPFLRAYAHCSKRKEGVTLLLINLSKTTKFTVSVGSNMIIHMPVSDTISRDNSFTRFLKRTVSWVGRKALESAGQREEYLLTPKDGNLQSQTMLLNGIPLELSEDGGIASMDPVFADVDSPISIAPLSIAFVTFPNIDAPACR